MTVPLHRCPAALPRPFTCRTLYVLDLTGVMVRHKTVSSKTVKFNPGPLRTHARSFKLHISPNLNLTVHSLIYKD
jgi:hypothetical protein